MNSSVWVSGYLFECRPDHLYESLDVHLYI
jgi:hypothetical protein